MKNRNGGTRRHWNTNLLITTPEGAKGAVFSMFVDVGMKPPAITNSGRSEDSLVKTARDVNTSSGGKTAGSTGAARVGSGAPPQLQGRRRARQHRDGYPGVWMIWYSPWCARRPVSAIGLGRAIHTFWAVRLDERCTPPRTDSRWRMPQCSESDQQHAHEAYSVGPRADGRISELCPEPVLPWRHRNVHVVITRSDVYPYERVVQSNGPSGKVRGVDRYGHPAFRRDIEDDAVVLEGTRIHRAGPAGDLPPSAGAGRRCGDSDRIERVFDEPPVALPGSPATPGCRCSPAPVACTRTA